MVNPVLRKLSDRRLSPFEIASLVEKHIGDGSNEFHCEQAYNALTRIRQAKIRQVVRAHARIQKSFNNYSATIKSVIRILRSEAWDSECCG